MAATHQAILTDAPRTSIEEQEPRMTLPEATMFIVGSSGALWVVLFGLVSHFWG